MLSKSWGFVNFARILVCQYIHTYQQSVSAIDIILTCVLLGSIAYGVWKGLIRQVASLGGIVLGLVACRIFGSQAGATLTEMFPGTFHSTVSAAIVGNVLLFILVWLTVSVIASMLHKVTHALMFGWLDHLLGSVFALFKWLLVLSILLNLWHIVAPESSIFKTSVLMDGDMLPWVMKIAPTMFGIVMGNTTVVMPSEV